MRARRATRTRRDRHERRRRDRAHGVPPAGDASRLLERGSDGDDPLSNGWPAGHLLATSIAADQGLQGITVGANVDERLVGYPAFGMLSVDSFGFAATGDVGGVLADVMRTAHRRSTLDGVTLQALDAADAVAGLPRSGRRNRTAAAFAEKGTGGTDHGWGSAAIVMGTGVDGGWVRGDWPGLHPTWSPTHGATWSMTTDHRDVLAEVVAEVLGGDAASALPGFERTPLGLFA